MAELNQVVLRMLCIIFGCLSLTVFIALEAATHFVHSRGVALRHVTLITFLACFLAALAPLTNGQIEPDFGNITSKSPEKRALSLFQVIRFPNTACTGTSGFNGTCYTNSECLNKGGTVSGTCANGFGVCCAFVVGCGTSTAQNCTYFQVSGMKGGVCSAQICKCSSDICQLRLDFATFVIAGPSTLTDTTANTVSGAIIPNGGAPVSLDTQCLTDTFVVTSPGETSPPVICGSNTNQHMYVNANDLCNTLTFNLGSTSFGTIIPVRSWNIKVTQISCTDFNLLAPSGCTQYFTQMSGTFSSYNYNDQQTAHQLANQRETFCFRRELNTCRICYWAKNPADFAVSNKAAGGVTKSTQCCSYGSAGVGTSGYDCVMIPGALTSKAVINAPNSICGNSAGLVAVGMGASTTICSRQTPFTFSFFTDSFTFVNAMMTAAVKGFTLQYLLFNC